MFHNPKFFHLVQVSIVYFTLFRFIVSCIPISKTEGNLSMLWVRLIIILLLSVCLSRSVAISVSVKLYIFTITLVIILILRKKICYSLCQYYCLLLVPAFKFTIIFHLYRSICKRPMNLCKSDKNDFIISNEKSRWFIIEPKSIYNVFSC